MNKTVFITGAAKRIGKAIALAFKDLGWNIIIHYNSSKEAADDLATEINNSSANSAITVQGNLDIKEVQASEEKNILKRIKQNSLIISFDRKGKQLNSLQFANLTQEFWSSGKSCSLIIGGSYGLSESFLEKSDHVISFSALTFPHKLFKILLIEQLYRSITIIKNKPYHK